LTTIIVLIISLFAVATNASEALEKVSLQLDMKYQFQFAGYIAAKEKGFYQEAGLDVELIEYQQGMDIFEDVLARKTHYGINKSSVFVKDHKIIPISLLASYFQKSPHVLVTSKAIKSPNDLMGKVIKISSRNLRQSALAQLFSHFYLSSDNTVFVDQIDSLDDLIQHKVDAVSIYSTNEPFELIQKNFEYNIIDPADYGYGSGAGHLFTSPSELREYPDRTKKFIAASNKGWEYALEHQKEIVGIIYHKYSKMKSIEALSFEAIETEKLMKSEAIAIGTVSKNSQQKLVKQLKRSGLLAEDQELSGLAKNVLFTPEQISYLKTKKEITMCVTPEWMPFERIHNGQHVGIVADIIKSFQQQLVIPIKLIQTSTWVESLSKVKQRKCDILSLAAKTPERSSYLNFTKPYLKLPIVMATKIDTLFISDIAEVRDKPLGIVQGYAVADKLRELMPDINIIAVASMEEGLSRVESGELFAYIDNLMVIASSLQTEYTGVLKVSARLDIKSELSIASRNDQPQLNEIFNLLVENIDDAELQTIYNKWVAVKQDPVVDYSFVWKALAIMLFVSVCYIYFYLKLRRLNEKLVVLSTTDKLTGLYNRVKTDDVILHHKAGLDRYGNDLSIILLDIDFFKRTNDKYGHLVGDGVLIEFADLIKANVRETDFAGRWGGEEFLIVCPNIEGDHAKELAEKLLNKVRNHTFSVVGKLSASAGVCHLSKTMSIKAAMQNVDDALYQSKQNGRDQVTAHQSCI